MSRILFRGGGGVPGPHPRGKLRGLAGGVSRPRPGGVSPQQMATPAGAMHPTEMHSCQLNGGGVSRPTPKGEVVGSGGGGGVSRPTPEGGGSPGPDPGVYSSMH